MKILFSLFLSFLFFACSDTTGSSENPSSSEDSSSSSGLIVEGSHSGKVLLNSQKIDAQTKESIKALVKFSGLPSAEMIAMLAAHDVEMHKLTFKTQQADGTPVEATGTVSFPTTSDQTLRVLSYQHGTIFKWDDVSSETGFQGGDGFISLIGSSFGNIILAPDYVGLGGSKGALRPFLHAKSAGIQTRDFIIAAREFLESTEIPHQNAFSLLGYSEGGYNTLAAQKEIETNPISGFALLGSAPMGGPYDLSGSMFPLMTSTSELPFPPYLPYSLHSYNRIYKIWDTPEAYLNEELAPHLTSLLEGDYSASEIADTLPPFANQILLASEFAKIKAEEDHPLRLALKENDLHNWTPQTPTQFYHCKADEIIPFSNAENAYKAMKANGAPVELIESEGEGHTDCAPNAIIAGLRWLITLDPKE